MGTNPLIDQIVATVKKIINDPRSPVPRTTYGVFVAADGTDANLSKVTIGTATFNRVRKLKHVSLTAGDVVMMLNDGQTPLTIIGVVTGNVQIG